MRLCLCVLWSPFRSSLPGAAISHAIKSMCTDLRIHTHYNCARSSTLQRTSKCVLTSTIKKPTRNVKRLHPSCKYVDDQRAIKSLRVRPRAREATRATASQILGIDSSCFTSTCMSRSIAFSPFSLTSRRMNSTHSVREMMPSPLRARGQSAGSEHSEGDEGGSNNQSA